MALTASSAQGNCVENSIPRQVEVVHQGEACECGKNHGYHVEVPLVTEHRNTHYDYGYTVQVPEQAPEEVNYSFDFHMEKPLPIKTEQQL